MAALSLLLLLTLLFIAWWTGKQSKQPGIEQGDSTTNSTPSPGGPSIATPDPLSESRVAASSAHADPGGKPAAAVVTVVNPEYQPESGANVLIWDGQVHTQVGPTDDAGRIELNWPRSEEVWLTATRAECASEEFELQSPFPAEITIILEPAGVLEGTVRHPDGRSAGGGLRVLAVPAENKGPSALLFQRARSDPARAHSVLTKVDGSFEIAGLRTGRGYCVLAMGPGVCTLGMPGPFRAGDGIGHDLTVYALFAMHIDLYDRSVDAPITLSSRYLFDVGFVIKLKHSGLRSVGVAPLTQRYLAGAPLAISTEGYSIDDYFVSDDEDARPDPLRCHIEISGYEPWDGLCNIAPLLNPVPRQRVYLTPVTTERGTVVLRLPPSMRRKATRAGMFPARLTLFPKNCAPMDFAVDPDESGDFVIEGVPCGECQCLLAGFPEGGRSPSAEMGLLRFTVSPTSVLIELPEDGLGHLELDPRRVDGSGYVGYLECMLLRGTAPGGSTKGFKSPGGPRRFNGPPYRIECLNPGEYTIQLIYPKVEPGVFFATAEPNGSPCVIQVP